MALRFDEEKATQAAALFLSLRGGRMHYLKLIKLLYLADRAALLRWGVPITTDRYVSMDHGPVLSNVFNLITDDKPKPVWARFISPPLGDYEVELLRDATIDRLSRAEDNLLREIYAEYGYRNRWDIVDNVMHKLPEWRDPHGSSIPIGIREILQTEWQDEDEIRAVIRELYAMGKAEEILANIRQMLNCGDTFYAGDTEDEEPHLCIIITPPTEGEVVTVSVTTQRKHSETLVKLAPGDHPFVTKDSVIAYAYARIRTVEDIESALSDGTARKREAVTPQLLNRVQMGLLDSDFTPYGVKHYYRSVMEHS